MPQLRPEIEPKIYATFDRIDALADVDQIIASSRHAECTVATEG
jgi:hypothetical protein